MCDHRVQHVLCGPVVSCMISKEAVSPWLEECTPLTPCAFIDTSVCHAVGAALYTSEVGYDVILYVSMLL